MRKITLQEKLRYAFDNTLSRGTIALIGWLGIVSAAMITVISLFVALTHIAPINDDGSNIPFIELLWKSLMRTLDPGTMGGDTGGWPFLMAMLSVTLGGIFIVSTLIGVLNSGIEAKIDELRKGRSFVVEKNHTVILGWSEQVFSIISEVAEANANKKRGCIVIMAEKDKVEMEDEIRAKVPSTKTTHVVCRTGSPMDLTDIDMVNLDDAKAIIVLSPQSDDPDPHIIKTILAITNNQERKSEPYHIVAEIRNPKNMTVAKMVGKHEVTLVLVGDLVSRIMVQTCRQSGLSIVYTELLDFGGDEIYFHEEASLTGQTFGDSLFAFEDSAIMGLFTHDNRILLNPPMDTVIATGDRVIAISEDDDTIKLSGLKDYQLAPATIAQTTPLPKQPEKTLILGWNQRGATIVTEMDKYVSPGSAIWVAAHLGNAEADIKEKCSDLKNLKLYFDNADTTDRTFLDSLDIAQFDHVITLSYGDNMGVQEADSLTLVTLLHLRDISDIKGIRFSIVSEMLDARNRELAEVTRADDFIVSDKLIALMLSQLSENKYLNEVFTDLFDPDGSEIYLKPATDYITPGIEVNFYTVLEAAKRKNEVAIGYKINALKNDSTKAFGVAVNPKKSKTIAFSAEDKVIVLAED